MKILLQQVRDGRYYQGQDAWTEDHNVAHEFRTSRDALETCAKERLPPMQLVFKFENSSLDFVFPCRNVCDEEGGQGPSPSEGER